MIHHLNQAAFLQEEEKKKKKNFKKWH